MLQLLLFLISLLPTDRERADLVVGQAQRELAGRLTAAIQATGPAGALETCSIVALSVTDSVARANNVELRRATLKPRNLHNEASELERDILTRMETQLRERGSIDTMLRVVNDTTHVFYPIRIVAQPCLACHGNLITDLKPETRAAIQDRYPRDQAFGYNPGDLRGVWHVVVR
jgi:hypothetical protein